MFFKYRYFFNLIFETMKPFAIAKANSAALIEAAKNGDIATVRANIKAVRIPDDLGMTALMHAAVNGHIDVVRTLRLFEARMTDDNGYTALMHATFHNRQDVVKLLIHSEARIGDKKGMTALMHAASWGRDDIVEILLSHEAKLTDGNGMTALMHACRGSSYTSARILLDIEAGMVDHDNQTALWHLAFLWRDKAGEREICAALIPHEAGKSNKHGVTSLMHLAHRAKKEESCPLVISLAQHEAKCVDNEGQTALENAVFYHNMLVFKIFYPLEKNLMTSKGVDIFGYAIKKLQNADFRSIDFLKSIITFIEDSISYQYTAPYGSPTHVLFYSSINGNNITTKEAHNMVNALDDTSRQIFDKIAEDMAEGIEVINKIIYPLADDDQKPEEESKEEPLEATPEIISVLNKMAGCFDRLAELFPNIDFREKRASMTQPLVTEDGKKVLSEFYSDAKCCVLYTSTLKLANYCEICKESFISKNALASLRSSNVHAPIRCPVCRGRIEIV